jgi:hypothetical protein
VLGMCGLAAIIYAVRRRWNGPASGAVNPTTAEVVEEPTFINDASSSDNSVDMSSEDTDENDDGAKSSADSAKSSADSASSLGLSAESSDDAELHSDGAEEEDLPEYGESDDPEREYSGSDATAAPSETHSAYSEDQELHSDLQDPDSGAGTEGVPSSEPGSWDSDGGGSEESRRESDHDSDDSVGLLHTEMSNPLHSDSWESEPVLSHESGSGEEAVYSDNESEGSIEEGSW